MIAGSNSEETIFAHALGIDSAAEREAYLREAPVALEEKDMARVRTWLAEPAGSVAAR